MAEPNSPHGPARHYPQVGVGTSGANSTRGAGRPISSAMRETSTPKYRVDIGHCAVDDLGDVALDPCRSARWIPVMGIPVVCFVHVILRLLPRPKFLRSFVRARTRVPDHPRRRPGSIGGCLFLFPLTHAGANVDAHSMTVNYLSGLRTYGTAWVSWLIGEPDTGLGFFRQGLRGVGDGCRGADSCRGWG